MDVGAGRFTCHSALAGQHGQASQPSVVARLASSLDGLDIVIFALVGGRASKELLLCGMGRPKAVQEAQCQRSRLKPTTRALVFAREGRASQTLVPAKHLAQLAVAILASIGGKCFFIFSKLK